MALKVSSMRRGLEDLERARLGRHGGQRAGAQRPAGKAALYLYYIPVLSTILGWLILGEVITLGFLFAGVLIILGVMIGTGALKPNPFWKIKKLSKTPIKGPCKDMP